MCALVEFLSLGGSLSTLLIPVFEFTDCIVTVMCISSESTGNCSVQYGQDPSYQDLSLPIQSPLNSTFPLPLLESNTVYYYLATVTINPTFTVQLPGTFMTGQCEICQYKVEEVKLTFALLVAARLTGADQGLLAVGIVLFLLSIVIAIILTVLEITKQGKYIILTVQHINTVFRLLVVLDPVGGRDCPDSGVCGSVDCSMCTCHTTRK